MARYPTAERMDVEARRVERVYSALARVYDDFFDWALGPGRRRAVSGLTVASGDRILEVGVGTGLSLPLYPADCEVTGIDITEPMLERARARLDELGRTNVHLRRMDAAQLKFEDGVFTHVVAPYVISVVSDPRKVLSEMRRVCRPGGTVVVLNHFASDHPVLAFAERIFTPLTQWIGFRLDLPLATVADTPGLEVVRIEKVNLFGLWRLVELRRTS
jgi:phosphatidylethanolamine/phosphatidyl-N-methylethanolamine N-methyltransferase